VHLKSKQVQDALQQQRDEKPEPQDAHGEEGVAAGGSAHNQQDGNGMAASSQSEGPVPKQFRSIDHNDIVDAKNKQAPKLDAVMNNAKRQNYVDGYNDYVDSSKQ